MDKKNKKLVIVASFENASILRKFTILFLLASIVPLCLLYYVHLESKTKGYIDLTSASFTIALFLTALGVLVGYSSLHSLMKTVINITKENREALKNVLSPKTLEEIDKEENEILLLSRSFSAVTKQLEDNIKSLEMAKKTLQSVMAKVGEGISSMEKIDTFLELILETTTNALGAKTATLLLLDESKTQLAVNSVFGTKYDKQKKPSY